MGDLSFTGYELHEFHIANVSQVSELFLFLLQDGSCVLEHYDCGEFGLMGNFLVSGGTQGKVRLYSKQLFAKKCECGKVVSKKCRQGCRVVY